jgi:hypothetical protein
MAATTDRVYARVPSNLGVEWVVGLVGVGLEWVTTNHLRVYGDLWDVPWTVQCACCVFLSHYTPHYELN